MFMLKVERMKVCAQLAKSGKSAELFLWREEVGWISSSPNNVRLLLLQKVTFTWIWTNMSFPYCIMQLHPSTSVLPFSVLYIFSMWHHTAALCFGVVVWHELYSVTPVLSSWKPSPKTTLHICKSWCLIGDDSFDELHT